MTTLQIILTTVAAVIVAPNVVFAVWVVRNEWRRGRARRVWDRHVEDAIRVARPTVEDWSR